MKLGLSVWAMPGTWDIETKFAKAKEAGFEGVEVALERNGAINLSTTKEELLEIKALAKKHGVELYSVACGLGFECPVGHPDDEKRAEAVEIVKKQLFAAEVLGCDTILVVPANVNQGMDYEEVYKKAVSSLRELAPIAEQHGVVIAVENVWNKFLMSPLEMRNFIDEVGSPYVQAYFDVGNVLNFGFPDNWIEILNSRIRKVHVKDFLVEQGNMSGFSVRLLEGNVNFSLAMSALRKVGYDSWITAETPFDMAEPEKSNEYTLNAMKKIIKM